jgi:hypothetical protein
MKKNLLIASFLVATSGVFAQTPRLSLYEEFTGETCPPCASTNPGLNALLALPTNTTKVVALKWQVPIPSASTKTWSLYQTNKAEIDFRYKSTSGGGYGYAISSAPSGKMDGQNVTVFGASSNHPANLTSGVISTAASYTSAFNIDMKHEWNSTKSAVVVTVNIAATANFSAVGNLVFRCIMVEKVIQFSVQPGTNGEKLFEDVAIKSYPTLQNGTAMQANWTNGQTQSFVLTCSLPSYIRSIEQIGMVGFIQDDGNYKVAQAARSKVMYDAAASTVQVDNTCSATLSPVVKIENHGTSAITVMTIIPSFDGTAQAPISWSGNLAPGASTNLTINNLTSPTTAGGHAFEVNISALDGDDFFYTNNVKSESYMFGSNAVDINVAEGFTANVFPPVKWVSVNANKGAGWTRSSNAGMYVNPPVALNSTKYDFFNNTVVGDIDELLLPPTNLTGGSAPILHFDYSYAQRTMNSDDALDVKVSDDCGQSWQSVFNASGLNGLTTAQPAATSFVPNPYSPTDWMSQDIPLTGYNKTNILVKFVVTSDNGNNLYLDNINLRQDNQVGIQKNEGVLRNVLLFPNPSNGKTTLQVESFGQQAATISLTNMLGQVVYNKPANLNGGTNTITLDASEFAAGVYNVCVETSEGKVVLKLNVN